MILLEHATKNVETSETRGIFDVPS